MNDWFLFYCLASYPIMLGVVSANILYNKNRSAWTDALQVACAPIFLLYHIGLLIGTPKR